MKSVNCTKMPKTEINLRDQLLERYGPLVRGSDLYEALGFRTYGAFRFALGKGEIPIRVFKLPHRRDWYSLSGDLAEWLSGLTDNVYVNHKEESEM
jgi:hypothetical protein